MFDCICEVYSVLLFAGLTPPFYTGRKSPFFHTPLHSTPPLGEFPSEYRHPLWYGKTGMVSLPDGEKISKIPLFVLAQLTNVMNRQTDRHRVTAYTALMHMHRAVKKWKKNRKSSVDGTVSDAAPELCTQRITAAVQSCSCCSWDTSHIQNHSMTPYNTLATHQ